MKLKQMLAAGTAAAVVFSASACSKEEIQDKIWEKLNEEVFVPYKTAPETEKPAAATTTAAVYDVPSASDFLYHEEDGGIVITEYRGSARNLAIPAEIDGLPVTVIGSGSYIPVSTTLRGVMIPETVTTLRAGAFYGCEKLINVVIPESVTSFGESLSYRVFGVFEDTVWLRKKQKEDPLVIVNHIVIDGKACTGDVAVPEGVTQIADGAFQDCEAITGVTLPNTLERIGEKAFDDCTALERIEIPNKTIEIGMFAFDSSRWLKKKKYAERSLVIVNHVLIDAYYDDTGGMIPDTVTAIAGGAFSNAPCERVVIPDGVTEIPAYCFSSSSLKEVVLPDSVTEIGSCAFTDCQRLTEIEIPDGVTKIGNYAFSDCEALKKITLPDGLTEIGDHAFDSCWELEKITLPDGLKFLGEEAFSPFSDCEITYRGKVYTVSSYAEGYSELYAAIEANR